MSDIPPFCSGILQEHNLYKATFIAFLARETSYEINDSRLDKSSLTQPLERSRMTLPFYILFSFIHIGIHIFSFNKQESNRDECNHVKVGTVKFNLTIYFRSWHHSLFPSPLFSRQHKPRECLSRSISSHSQEQESRGRAIWQLITGETFHSIRPFKVYSRMVSKSSVSS